MKSASRFVAVIATALLHATLITVVITGLNSKQNAVLPPKPIAIELLQEKPAPPAALPVAPVVAPPQPPHKKQPEPKPHAAPKPAAPTHEPAPAQVKTPEVIKTPEVTFAPAPSAAPAAPASEASQPVKTGVSISASYAASNRKPPYPRLSRQNEEQGVVELRVFVKADGTAGTVEVASPSGYALLDESAKSTVQTWRFNPATVDGKPVGEWYRVPIPFKLQN